MLRAKEYLFCKNDYRAIQRVFGVDAPEKELRERELGGRISRSSAVGRSACVAASRSRVGLGCGRGGGATKRWQRSKNSANESCVAASASVASMTLPVTFRVRPAGTCELTALCGNCGMDTKPESAVPLDSCVEASGCADDEELAPACNCWRQCSAEGRILV